MQLDLMHLWFLHVWVVGREEWVRGGQTARGRDPHFQCKGQCDVTSSQKYPRSIWSHLGFLALWSFIPLSPFFLHCIHLKMLHRKDICLRCGEIHLSHSLYCLLLQCLKARTRRLKFTNINSNVRKLNSSRTREAKTYFPHGHLVSHLPCLFPQQTYGATVCFLALLQSNWFSQKHLRIKIGLYK